MNNNILVTKQDEIKKNIEALVAKSKELDDKVQALLAEKEQVKRNFDANNGALQILELLMKENEPVETPKLEILD